MRSVLWFRNDLRLRDNPALDAAARASDELLCLFVVDPQLLTPGAGTRRAFLAESLESIAVELADRGHELVIRRGPPAREVARVLRETGAEALHWNRATTPLARARDEAVRKQAEKAGVSVTTHKAQVVFEASELRTGKGTGYAVYTPYKRSWRRRYEEEAPERLRLPRLPAPVAGLEGLTLERALAVIREPKSEAPRRELGGGEARARRRLDRFLGSIVQHYGEWRDLPARDGTSRLSPYLRFGCISARECVHKALEAAAMEPAVSAGAQKWVDELIWRDFYAGVLEENPHVTTGAYRREYDALEWESDPQALAAWREGRTGFPIVDAGMRQLHETGWMHNRVRMIVASFLTKDLGIHWLEGERWFAERLVDYDPASNNGGWQWSASTGTDAQPYFRIFNPVRQGKRFDPEGDYVRRWVPELAELEGAQIHEPSGGLFDGGYPPPIVDHAEARERTLARFARARGDNP